MPVILVLVLTHLAATAAVTGVLFWELYRHFFDGPCGAGTAAAAVLPLLIYPLGGWLARRHSLPLERHRYRIAALVAGLAVAVLALYSPARVLVLLPVYVPVYELTQVFPSMGLPYDLRMSILEPALTIALQWGYLLLFWLAVRPRTSGPDTERREPYGIDHLP